MPYSVNKPCVDSLASHRIYMCKGRRETGLTVYRPYTRRLESLTKCRCLYKGSTISIFIVRPRVLVRLAFEPAAYRSADRRLTSWANWAAVNSDSLGLLITCVKNLEGCVKFVKIIFCRGRGGGGFVYFHSSIHTVRFLNKWVTISLGTAGERFGRFFMLLRKLSNFGRNPWPL